MVEVMRSPEYVVSIGKKVPINYKFQAKAPRKEREKNERSCSCISIRSSKEVCLVRQTREEAVSIGLHYTTANGCMLGCFCLQRKWILCDSNHVLFKIRFSMMYAATTTQIE